MISRSSNFWYSPRLINARADQCVDGLQLGRNLELGFFGASLRALARRLSPALGIGFNRLLANLVDVFDQVAFGCQRSAAGTGVMVSSRNPMLANSNLSAL